MALQLISTDKKTIYDALPLRHKKPSHGSINLDGYIITFNIHTLKSLSAYTSSNTAADLKLITQTLSTDVINLGDIKAFKGSENGTNLSYMTTEDIDGKYLLVFSQGEIQPGREVCYFEAAFKYD